ICGGLSHIQSIRTVQIYDDSEAGLQRWTAPLEQMNVERAYAHAISMPPAGAAATGVAKESGGYVYVLGGNNNESGGSWTPLTSMERHPPYPPPSSSPPQPQPPPARSSPAPTTLAALQKLAFFSHPCADAVSGYYAREWEPRAPLPIAISAGLEP